jgi:HSP20 family protein
MTEDMDRLFEDFALGRNMRGAGNVERDLWSSTADRASWTPQVETFRRGDKLVVRADLPGMKREDVNVEIEDGVLTISGERSDEREEKSDEFYRSERSYGQFCRTIPLPQGVSSDQADATFKDGVLEVAFPSPKQQERKSKVQIR